MDTPTQPPAPPGPAPDVGRPVDGGGAGASDDGTVLLLLDFINDLEFDGAEALLPRALEAAEAARRLRDHCRAAGVPVVYVNDNYDHWRDDLHAIVEHCRTRRGRPLVEVLEPGPDDLFVVKPRHSGFHGTSLGPLLQRLSARRLVLTGLAGDICVLITAVDAYMRHYRTVVVEDAVASEDPDENEHALAWMRRVLDAETVTVEELVGG